MKKAILWILAAMMALLCAVPAGAGEYAVAEFTWTLDDEGTLHVEGTGAMEDGTFWQDSIQPEQILRVEIGEGVTGIGENAFSGCTGLTEVVLPESLTTIGEGAFDGCGQLTEMTLPDHITEINGVFLSEATERIYLSDLHTETGITLGSWEIPFYLPGDNTAYIHAHDETSNYLGLAVYAPEDPDAETAVFPEGVECIKPGYLMGMTHVRYVRIPDSMTDLSIVSFGGMYRDTVILCSKGSAAERFAQEQGLQYDNGEEQVIGYGITDPDEKARWVVEHYVRPDMTEREKALVLHNWIINNSRYDKDKTIYESDMILTDGFGVCQAYAGAYYRLLQEAGIAVCTLSGEAVPGGSEGHEWNMVRIDGTWYHVDCTWDDRGSFTEDSPCVSGQEGTKYFLMTDSEIAEDHMWDPHYSADRGRMYQYYDPEAGHNVRQQCWSGDCTYLLDWQGMQATVLDVCYEESTEMVIPDEFEEEIDYQRWTFQVTGIEPDACRGNTVLGSVEIGENVEFIGDDAFRGCTQLNKIVIRTKKLNAETFGENAFAEISSNAAFSCPESKLEEYRTILQERLGPDITVTGF